MRKYILLIAVALSSCAEPKQESKEPKIISVNNGYSGLQVVEIDGCEYVYNSQYQRAIICHKGNCKYCAKRNIDNDPK